MSQLERRRSIRAEPRDSDVLNLRLLAMLDRHGVSADALSPAIGEMLLGLLEDLEQKQIELEAAREQAEQHERLAYEDAFMPIGNRRAFVRELTRILAVVKRHGIGASIVYFDLNGLKQINDRLGHNAGDAALMQVAKVLCEHVRESDVVARLGGDEFAVLLPRTDAATAEKKARTLMEAIAAAPVPWEGQAIPLKTAYGAYQIAATDTVSSALDAADRAMYKKKQQMKAITQIHP